MPTLNDFDEICIGERDVWSICLGENELWSNIQPTPVSVPPTKYLTFTSTGGNVLSMSHMNGNSPTMWYSLNGEDWFVWDYRKLIISNEHSVYIAGDNPNGISSYSDGSYPYSHFVIFGNGTVTCTGDVMSLINPYQDVLTIPCSYCFYHLFLGCTSLVTAPTLPATTLASHCYQGMFRHSGIVIPPSLPAVSLKVGCYEAMFYDCTALSTAPELHATIMKSDCYRYMFNGCTSLTIAPTLSSTSLASSCYSDMFNDCTSLTTAPELPATTLANWCYLNMFAGCTSLTTAPNLPAVTLAYCCYYQMFSGCTNLNYVKCLATDISATSCLNDWLSNVSSTGTFIKDPNMSDWSSGSSGIPSGWTVRNTDNYVKIDSSSSSSLQPVGRVIEVSTNYDTSDYTNNPPTIYLQDDTDLSDDFTVTWNSRTVAVLRVGKSILGRITFNDDTLPTSYTFNTH